MFYTHAPSADNRGMFMQTVRPLPPRHVYVRRQINTLTIGLLLVAVSLLIGMAGFHFIEHMAWIDAFLNASMLLGGMGPVAEMKSSVGKLFSGVYALYSGLVLLIAASIIFSPAFHRILHVFHISDLEDNQSENDSQADHRDTRNGKHDVD